MNWNVRLVADGLAFPEGPIAMPDGSVIVTEMRSGKLTRVQPDGSLHRIASVEGVPNGAAMGPDGHCYIANNGGMNWHDLAGVGRVPTHGVPEGYTGAWVERVDLETGKVERVCDGIDGRRFRGLNDLCFDRQGGLWVTDYGKTIGRDTDVGSVYYIEPGFGAVREGMYPAIRPNGVGLSPDERTLYVAETLTTRLWAFNLSAPGTIEREPWPSPNGGRVLGGVVGYRSFDSLAVDSEGHIWVANLFFDPGVLEFAPSGEVVSHVPIDEPYVTNVCFGGPNLQTGYVTCASKGLLLAFDAPRPGLPSPFPVG